MTIIILSAANLLIAKQINYDDSYKLSEPFESLSLIIAARNEEKNILSLLDILKQQNYDLKKVEIIVVDDHSEDNTLEMINQFDHGSLNIKPIKNDTNQQGKKYSLNIGIEKASNEFIIITDADCRPESNWLSDISCKLKNGNDLVFGTAPLKMKASGFSRYACFDNFRSQLLVFAAAKLGFPYSAAARSLAFRKSKFHSVGGFASHFQIKSGDDDLLLQSFKRNNYKIDALMTDESKVFSDAEKSLGRFLNQRSRHVSTSKFYDLQSQLFLTVWHGINFVSIASILIIPFYPLLSLLPVSKLLMDIFIVQSKQNIFDYKFSLVDIISYQLFYEILLPVIFIKSVFGKIEWK